MPAAPRSVLVLHHNGAARECFRCLSRRAYRCTFPDSWDALRQAVAEAPPSTIVVVDPYLDCDPRGPHPAPALRSLLWEFPSATVLAALEMRRGVSRDLRTLGAWGVADVISLDEEQTPEAFLVRLQTVDGRPLQKLLDRTLPSALTGRARLLLVTAAEVASAGGRARDLARKLHLSERSVLRWAGRAGLPPPRRIMAWMRILLAASLLDDPGRTVLRVARACGYASDGSLRRAMQEFLGAAPTALRREGAFRAASEGLVAELTHTRANAEDARAGERAAS